MSSYVNRLGMCGLPRHDHLIVAELPVINREEGTVTITFEKENIITNCTYSFDIEYGGQYYIKSLEGETVTFFMVGYHLDYRPDNKDLYEMEIPKIKVGDKMYFYSNMNIGGEYYNGRDFKYAEL